MQQSTGLSLGSIPLVAFIVIGQTLGAALLPRTAAFTSPLWTAACLGAYLASFYGMAYIIHQGLPLGVIVAILVVTIPLATIAISVTFYGESASIVKIAVLGVACILVGYASTLK